MDPQMVRATIQSSENGCGGSLIELDSKVRKCFGKNNCLLQEIHLTTIYSVGIVPLLRVRY